MKKYVVSIMTEVFAESEMDAARIVGKYAGSNWAARFAMERGPNKLKELDVEVAESNERK